MICKLLFVRNAHHKLSTFIRAADKTKTEKGPTSIFSVAAASFTSSSSTTPENKTASKLQEKEKEISELKKKVSEHTKEKKELENQKQKLEGNFFSIITSCHVTVVVAVAVVNETYIWLDV